MDPFLNHSLKFQALEINVQLIFCLLSVNEKKTELNLSLKFLLSVCLLVYYHLAAYGI